MNRASGSIPDHPLWVQREVAPGYNLCGLTGGVKWPDWMQEPPAPSGTASKEPTHSKSCLLPVAAHIQ